MVGHHQGPGVSENESGDAQLQTAVQLVLDAIDAGKSEIHCGEHLTLCANVGSLTSFEQEVESTLGSVSRMIAEKRKQGAESQVVLFAGESGSGKTHQTMSLLRALITDKAVEDLLVAITQCLHDLMERCTPLNDRSSRLSKFFELAYGSDSILSSIKVTAGFLELDRIQSPFSASKTETNFRIVEALGVVSANNGSGAFANVRGNLSVESARDVWHAFMTALKRFMTDSDAKRIQDELLSVMRPAVQSANAFAARPSAAEIYQAIIEASSDKVVSKGNQALKSLLGDRAAVSSSVLIGDIPGSEKLGSNGLSQLLYNAITEAVIKQFEKRVINLRQRSAGLSAVSDSHHDSTATRACKAASQVASYIEASVRRQRDAANASNYEDYLEDLKTLASRAAFSVNEHGHVVIKHTLADIGYEVSDLFRGQRDGSSTSGGSTPINRFANDMRELHSALSHSPEVHFVLNLRLVPEVISGSSARPDELTIRRQLVAYGIPELLKLTGDSWHEASFAEVFAKFPCLIAASSADDADSETEAASTIRALMALVPAAAPGKHWSLRDKVLVIKASLLHQLKEIELERIATLQTESVDDGLDLERLLDEHRASAHDGVSFWAPSIAEQECIELRAQLEHLNADLGSLTEAKADVEVQLKTEQANRLVERTEHQLVIREIRSRLSELESSGVEKDAMLKDSDKRCRDTRAGLANASLGLIKAACRLDGHGELPAESVEKAVEAIRASLRFSRGDERAAHMSQIFKTIIETGSGQQVLHRTLPMVLLLQKLERSTSPADSQSVCSTSAFLQKSQPQANKLQAMLIARLVKEMRSQIQERADRSAMSLNAGAVAKRIQETLKPLTSIKGWEHFYKPVLVEIVEKAAQFPAVDSEELETRLEAVWKKLDIPQVSAWMRSVWKSQQQHG